MFKASTQDSRLLAFTGAIAFVLTLGYCFSIFHVLSLDFLPLTSDEAGYLKSIESSLLNGKLISSYFVDESFSKLGYFSSHGYIYSVIYGAPMKIFGFQPELFVWLNIAFTLAALIFVFSFKNLSLQNKLLFTIFYLSYFVIMHYSLTYMVESLHNFLIIPVSYLLIRYYQSGSRKALVSFLALVTLLSFIRTSWVFFVLGLLPYRHSRNHYASILIYFLLLLMVCMKYKSLFVAPYYSSFTYQMKNLYLDKGFEPFVFAFMTHGWNNFVTFFTDYFHSFYFLAKHTFLILLATCFFYARENRIFIAVTFISLSLFAALIFTYEVFGYREQRTISVLIIMMFFVLIWFGKTRVLVLLIVAQLVVYPDAIYEFVFKKHTAIQQQNFEINNLDRFNKVSNKLKTFQSENGPLIVTLGKPFANQVHLRLLLPFKNNAGQPILYDFLHHKESTFKSHYFLSLDTSNEKERLDNMPLMWNSNGLAIYAINENSKIWKRLAIKRRHEKKMERRRAEKLKKRRQLKRELSQKALEKPS